ncbi:hypothetical protein OUZ56_022914 [Daphnia magna]|uniref:Uncharacterized protein n=1 Tax=Daphnia magna TaxID=35525 RepID=A0ABR0AXW8_9CRUS|nr:hypothetical protein OUZ56_022914 [Daphnia magna]
MVILLSAMSAAKSKNCWQLITYGFHHAFLLLIERILTCNRLAISTELVKWHEFCLGIRNANPTSSKKLPALKFFQSSDNGPPSSPRPSLLCPSPLLHLARHPVAASSPRPSPRRRLFTSPVTPSPPLHLARHPVAASWSPLQLARHPVVASWSPRHRGSGSAVLPNGLYAMGGTVAQAVWLKVDRRGNAPLGTSPLVDAVMVAWGVHSRNGFHHRVSPDLSSDKSPLVAIFLMAINLNLSWGLNPRPLACHSDAIPLSYL